MHDENKMCKMTGSVQNWGGMEPAGTGIGEKIFKSVRKFVYTTANRATNIEMKIITVTNTNIYKIIHNGERYI
jgi:hypothetical protein